MPGQEKKLIHTPYHAGQKSELDFISNLNPEWAEKTYQLNIIYDDIEGTTYSSKVQCGKDGIKLLETNKLSK